MPRTSEKICPRCDLPSLKSWDELSEDDQFLAKRLPMSAEFSPTERKKHRFCTRCWFESGDESEITVV